MNGAYIALGCALLTQHAVPAEAAPTITAAQWNAFADANAVNTCFPGFVVSFEDVSAVSAPPPVQIARAEYQRLSFGAALVAPMATAILGPDATAKPSALSAERDDTFVSFVVAAPGETARGFVLGNGSMPPLDAGPPDYAAAIVARLTPGLTHVPAGAGSTRCGFTRVTLVDKEAPDTGASIQLIVRDGKIVGGVETRL
jgi:hypothetical protein